MRSTPSMVEGDPCSRRSLHPETGDCPSRPSRYAKTFQCLAREHSATGASQGSCGGGIGFPSSPESVEPDGAYDDILRLHVGLLEEDGRDMAAISAVAIHQKRGCAHAVRMRSDGHAGRTRMRSFAQAVPSHRMDGPVDQDEVQLIQGTSGGRLSSRIPMSWIRGSVRRSGQCRQWVGLIPRRVPG